MEIIKTTKKQRDLYAKHLNQYVDYENEDWPKGKDRKCFMCEAVISTGKSLHQPSSFQCSGCPLDSRLTGVECTDGSYISSDWALFGGFKKVATKVAKSRMNWIIEQIHKFTDCRIEDDK